jgi:hypothetical protein
MKRVRRDVEGYAQAVGLKPPAAYHKGAGEEDKTSGGRQRKRPRENRGASENAAVTAAFTRF